VMKSVRILSESSVVNSRRDCVKIGQ
jgi:hypothetical protein